MSNDLIFRIIYSEVIRIIYSENHLSEIIRIIYSEIIRIIYSEILFLSDEGPMLETLDYTIRIGSTRLF